MRRSFSFKVLVPPPPPPLSATDVTGERVLGALLLRRDRGAAVLLDRRSDWSSGLGEEGVSCTRGGAAMTSLLRVLLEGVDEEEGSLPGAPGAPPRKTCVGPLELPAPRRLLSWGLIGQSAGRVQVSDSWKAS